MKRGVTVAEFLGEDLRPRRLPRAVFGVLVLAALLCSSTTAGYYWCSKNTLSMRFEDAVNTLHASGRTTEKRSAANRLSHCAVQSIRALREALSDPTVREEAERLLTSLEEEAQQR